jgi:hypothetical protein
MASPLGEEGGRLCGGPFGGFRLRRAVEPDDAMHPDVGHGLLCVVLLVRLYLADDLKVGTFGQTSCVFGCSNCRPGHSG